MTITTTTATVVPSQAPRGTGMRTGDGTEREAWQREMERAQARDWFRGAAADTPAAPAETHTRRGAAAQARPHMARACLPQAPVAWTTVTPLPPAAIPADPEQSGHTAWARPPSADGDDTFAGSTAAPDALTHTDRRTVDDRVRTAIASRRAIENTIPGRDAPPVRAYVEWQGGTAHVWIGIDARGAAQLTAIAEAVVQRLRDQGLRIGRLVCNGTEHPMPASITSNPSTTSEADVVVHITPPREF